MSDSSFSPVVTKMSEYARRMQALINEAYAEGIVLTAPAPEKGMVFLTPPGDQDIFNLAVTVPLLEHTHLNLKTPEHVIATAVIIKNGHEPESIVPSVRIPKPRKPTRIIPIRRPESEWCFVDPAVMAPWAIGNTGLQTSALKFGQKFDLLGLSYDELLLQRGLITSNDVIDPEVRIEKIYYRTVDGVVEAVDVTRTPFTTFNSLIQGDYRDMQVDVPIRVSLKGGPVMSEKETALLHLAGSINLQYGLMQLNVHVDDSRIEPLGYTLLAGRIKSSQS